MPIKFEVELDDQDLAQFQRMIDAKGVGSQVEVPDIVQATSELLDSARQAETPRFILEKLEQLEPLVAMVTDSEWRLPTDDIRRSVSPIFAVIVVMSGISLPCSGFVHSLFRCS